MPAFEEMENPEDNADSLSPVVDNGRTELTGISLPIPDVSDFTPAVSEPLTLDPGIFEVELKPDPKPMFTYDGNGHWIFNEDYTVDDMTPEAKKLFSGRLNQLSLARRNIDPVYREDFDRVTLGRVNSVGKLALSMGIPEIEDSLDSLATRAGISLVEAEHWARTDREYLDRLIAERQAVLYSGENGYVTTQLQTIDGAKRLRWDKEVIAKIDKVLAELAVTSPAMYEAKSIAGEVPIMLSSMWRGLRDVTNSAQIALMKWERESLENSFWAAKAYTEEERAKSLRELDSKIRTFEYDRDRVIEWQRGVEATYRREALVTGNFAYDYIIRPAMGVLPSMAIALPLGPAGGYFIAASYSAQGYNRAVDEGMDRSTAFLVGLGSGIGAKYFGDIGLGNFRNILGGKLPAGNWLAGSAHRIAVGGLSNFGQAASSTLAYALGKNLLEEGGSLGGFASDVYGDRHTILGEAYGGVTAALLGSLFGIPTMARNHARVITASHADANIGRMAAESRMFKSGQFSVLANEITQASRHNGAPVQRWVSAEALEKAGVTSDMASTYLGIDSAAFTEAKETGVDLAVPVGEAIVFAERQRQAGNTAIDGIFKADPAEASMAEIRQQAADINTIMTQAESMFDKLSTDSNDVPQRITTFRDGLEARRFTRDEANSLTSIMWSRAQKSADQWGVGIEQWLERKDVQLDFANSQTDAAALRRFQQGMEQSRAATDAGNTNAESILSTEAATSLMEAAQGDLPEAVRAGDLALERDSNAWQTTVDDFVNGRLNQRKPVAMLRQTPLVLQMLNAKNLPINTSYNILKKILVDKHKLPVDTVKQIPAALADPIMVFQSATRSDALVAMLDIKDKNGATIIVPIGLELTSKDGYSVNFAYSAYGKSSEGTGTANNQWFADQIRKGRLLYRNTEKSRDWARTAGLQLPGVGASSRGNKQMGRDWMRAAGLQLPGNNAPNRGNTTVFTEADLVKLRTKNPTLYQAGIDQSTTEQSGVDQLTQPVMGDADNQAWINETIDIIMENVGVEGEAAEQLRSVFREAVEKGLDSPDVQAKAKEMGIDLSAMGISDADWQNPYAPHINEAGSESASHGFAAPGAVQAGETLLPHGQAQPGMDSQPSPIVNGVVKALETIGLVKPEKTKTRFAKDVSPEIVARVREKFASAPFAEASITSLADIDKSGNTAPAIISWANENGIPGTYTNNDTGWNNITVSNASLRGVLFHHAGDGKVALILAIPELIRGGVYLESTVRNKQGHLGHVFASKVRLDATEFAVGLVITEDNNGNRFYNHEMTDLKKTLEELWQVPGSSDKTKKAPGGQWSEGPMTREAGPNREQKSKIAGTGTNVKADAESQGAIKREPLSRIVNRFVGPNPHLAYGTNTPSAGVVRATEAALVTADGTPVNPLNTTQATAWLQQALENQTVAIDDHGILRRKTTTDPQSHTDAFLDQLLAGAGLDLPHASVHTLTAAGERTYYAAATIGDALYAVCFTLDVPSNNGSPAYTGLAITDVQIAPSLQTSAAAAGEYNRISLPALKNELQPHKVVLGLLYQNAPSSPGNLSEARRAAAIRTKFEAAPSFDVSTASVPAKGPGYGGRLVKWAREHGIIGSYSNADTGWDNIRVSPSSIRDVNSHYAGPGKLAVLTAVPDLIKHGVFLETTARNDKGLVSHIFAGRVNLDGNPHIVGFTIFEDHNGRRYYNHEMTKVEALGVIRSEGTATQENLPSREPISSILSRYLNVKPGETLTSLDELHSGTRGLIDFQQARFNDPQAPTVIRLFESADVSTVLHELNHLFVDDLRQMVEAGHGGTEAAADWATLVDFTKGKLVSVSIDERRQAYEMIADASERYFTTAAAPRSDLVRPFDFFRTWMASIYRGVRMQGVEPLPAVRSVFDRFLATDEQIAEARNQANSAGQWEDAAGVSGDNRRRIKDARLLADHELRRQLDRQRVGFALRAIHQADDLDEEETENVPVYRAAEAIRQAGGMSRDMVAAMIGEDAAARMAARHGDELFGSGADVDHIAADNQYNKADALLADLAAVEPIEYAVNRRVEKALAEKEWSQEDADLREGGIALGDGSEAETESILTQIAVVIEEQARRNPSVDGAQAVREAQQAREAMEASVASRMRALPMAQAVDVRPFQAAKAKAARAAVLAAGDGNWDDVRKQLDFQLLHHLEIREAMAARQLRARTATFDDAGLARALEADRAHPAVEHLFVDPILALAQFMGWTTKSAPSVDAPMLPIPQLDPDSAVGQLLPDLASSIEPWLLFKQKPEGWQSPADFSYGQVEEALRVMDALLDQGRGTLHALGDGTARHLGDLITLSTAPMERPAAQRRTTTPDAIKTQAMWDRFLMRVSNPEALFVEMDGNPASRGKPMGINQRLFQKIQRCAAVKKDLYRDLAEQMDPHVTTLSAEAARIEAEMGGRHFVLDRLPVPENLRLARDCHTWSADMLVSLCLHMGNDAALAAIQEGYTLTGEQLQYLQSQISSDGWRAIQGIWDAIASLTPQLDALAYRLTNRHLEAEQPMPFVAMARDGEIEMRGGWYPLIADPVLSETTGERAASLEDRLFAMQKSAALQNLFTHARLRDESGLPVVTAPPLLSMSVLTGYLETATHLLSHAEAVAEFDRLASSPEWADAVLRNFGPIPFATIRTWLDGLARPERLGNEAGFAVMQWLRDHAAFDTGLAPRHASTLMGDAGPAGVSPVRYLWDGVRAVGRGGAIGKKSAAMQAIDGMSTFMHNREDKADHEMKRLCASLTPPKHGMTVPFINLALEPEWLRESMAGLVRAMDRSLAYAVWHGAYHQAVDGNAGVEVAGKAADRIHRDAVRYADRIATAQASAFRADLAERQRDGGLEDFLAMFMAGALRQSGRLLQHSDAASLGDGKVKELLRYAMEEHIHPTAAWVLVRSGVLSLLGTYDAGRPEALSDFARQAMNRAGSAFPLFWDAVGAAPFGRKGGRQPAKEEYGKAVADFGDATGYVVGAPLMNLIRDIEPIGLTAGTTE